MQEEASLIKAYKLLHNKFFISHVMVMLYLHTIKQVGLIMLLCDVKKEDLITVVHHAYIEISHSSFGWFRILDLPASNPVR
jgi:hypothetical protein